MNKFPGLKASDSFYKIDSQPQPSQASTKAQVSH